MGSACCERRLLEKMMTTELVKQLRQLSAENPSPRDCIDAAADELERLCAENGALKREAWTWSKACETATKQLEPERVDAKRYRWLRSWKRTAYYKVSRWIAGEGRYDPLPQEGGLDAAIDADMALTPNAEVTGA